MTARTKIILDPEKIFEDRKTKTDKEIEFENSVTRAMLVRQCWLRDPKYHPVFRHSEKRISQLPCFKIKEVVRVLNPKSWDEDERVELKTAKHEIIVPKGFEIVEYGSPCKAFFDKRNLWM